MQFLFIDALRYKHNLTYFQPAARRQALESMGVIKEVKGVLIP